MKKLLLLMMAGLLIVSCQKEEVQEIFDYGKVKSFHINGDYKSQDNSLKFTITAINDSRCPSDVVCVWEGKADVTIEVENPLEETIVLSTYDNRIDTVENFSIELVDVLPYPVSTDTIELEDYNVTLKILEIQF